MVKCIECNGFCCTHIAIPIQNPNYLEEYENIYWYLYHKDCTVFIGVDGNWYLQIEVPCKMRRKDGSCRIYKKRPPTCRAYTEAECERNKKDAAIHFKTVKDYDKYFSKIKKNFKIRNYE